MSTTMKINYYPRAILFSDKYTSENSIYCGLKYTTHEINSNFKIKVHDTVKHGKNLNKLVGVSGLIRLVDDIHLVNRLLNRAFNSLEDKCTCKLRRGLRITFYFH